jgi:hypothetical protein
MGTLGTILLIGGGLITLWIGYGIYKSFFAPDAGKRWQEAIATPQGQKSIKQLEEGLHLLEIPQHHQSTLHTTSNTTPPKAISHANLGHFMSFN